MSLEGKLLIGQQVVSGDRAEIRAINPASGETLEPVYRGGGEAEVERACVLAEAAFASYRETSLEARA
ncbi:aldehyde dehydrogenase (NADP(+)), partial [Halomonas sp. ML-15]|nr:aldehyde dehydrogenase (NADP(+)) [Halomonas sp. ML-15]